jgi:hypothetical protein
VDYLFSLSPAHRSWNKMWRYTATRMDKIQGHPAHRSPAADEIRAGVNLRPAKTLGLTVQPPLLLRADELIQ